jgi:3-oxoacyl-[acyl-carrier-protein] synthase I
MRLQGRLRPTILQPLEITALASANCLGLGVDATLSALRERRSGLQRCAFDTADLPAFVGQVDGLEEQPIEGELRGFDCRNNRLAQVALAQDDFTTAVARAVAKHGAARVGVFVGTSTSGVLSMELAYRRRDPVSGALPTDFNYAGTQNNFSLGAFLQRALGLQGPAVVVSSACSSSAKVFGNAQRAIATGLCDAAVVGGSDSLCLTTLYGFHSLGLVSPVPCRPFDAERAGISIGESAGFALLEKPGATTHADSPLLLGVGESSDAYHMSSPHPEGAGARGAMRQALERAGLTPSDIDYINLHGTATKTNDATEDLAVFSLFGADTPASSTKGWTGHALGAAGITEAIISLLALREGLMPGMVTTTALDPELRRGYLQDNRTATVRRVMSNSFGFGGSNCSLVFGRAG